ncbi:MAG: hypothetical protein ACREM1_16835, partial [Longimicrobiales bacterium]
EEALDALPGIVVHGIERAVNTSAFNRQRGLLGMKASSHGRRARSTGSAAGFDIRSRAESARAAGHRGASHGVLFDLAA